MRQAPASAECQLHVPALHLTGSRCLASGTLVLLLRAVSAHPDPQPCSSQEALRLADALIASWSEASPGDLSQAPTEACASTLGHILGCLRSLVASLDLASQARLGARFCPKLAQHLPAGLPAGPCSPAVRGALEDLNLAYLRFSLQAAEALATGGGQVRPDVRFPASS